MLLGRERVELREIVVGFAHLPVTACREIERWGRHETGHMVRWVVRASSTHVSDCSSVRRWMSLGGTLMVVNADRTADAGAVGGSSPPAMLLMMQRSQSQCRQTLTVTLFHQAGFVVRDSAA